MTGLALKTILMRYGKTQAEIAESIGETKQNFNSSLRSDDLKSSIIERVSVALNLTMAEIYGEASAPIASAAAGGTAIAGSGNNLNTQIDKFLDLLREKDVQIGRFQTEIDSLIEILKTQSK